MQTQIVTRTPEGNFVTEWYSTLELEVKAGEIAGTTSTTYQQGMGKFVDWLHENEIDQVGADVIKHWKADLQAQGMKPSTINTWLAGVRRFFDWALSNGLLTINPTEGVKGVKRKGTNKRHLRDPLTDREVLRVLSQPDKGTAQGKRDHAILCLMAYCALRTIEVHRADVSDLSTVDGLPVLRIQGKGSSEKDDIAVVYNAAAQEAIYDWLAVRGNQPGPLFISLSNRSHGERLTTSAIRHIVNGYYMRAGIVDKRKTTHSLRHSAISKVAKKNPWKARQVARHVSMDTTLIYAHENDRLDDPGEQFIQYVNGE